MWSNVVNDRPIMLTRKNNQIYDSDADSQASESEIEIGTNENESNKREKSVKVFDRFTVILQIFAKRAKTKIARLQIELSFLNYLKSKLMRGAEGRTYSSLFSIFTGDLMR